MTASMLHALESFYQKTAPTYVQYVFWLGHGLLGQWQPQMPDCPEGLTLLGSPVVYFEVGLIVWVILTIGFVAFSFATRQEKLPSPSS